MNPGASAGHMWIASIASVARAHIVSIGALGALTLSWALCGVRDESVAAFAAVDWFLVNWLNRLTDLVEDKANGIEKTDFVAMHKTAVVGAGIFVLVLSFLLTWQLVPALLFWRSAFHILGFAYNWPLLPGKKRIKELYFWKNTASATGFLLTCFAYPLALHPLRTDLTLAALFFCMAFFFLFELSYEVLYDLRDAKGDAVAGVRTYPVVHGPDVGWAIARVLMKTSGTSMM